VGTVNIGSRAPASLYFILRCARGGPLPHNGRRPRSGRVSDRFPDPEIIPRDHIPTGRGGHAGARSGGSVSVPEGQRWSRRWVHDWMI
jgi:hypothetical protein